jgi:hypothetical protein
MHIVLNFRNVRIYKKMCPNCAQNLVVMAKECKICGAPQPYKERKNRVWKNRGKIEQGCPGLTLTSSKTVVNAYVHVSENIVVTSIFCLLRQTGKTFLRQYIFIGAP